MTTEAVSGQARLLLYRNFLFNAYLCHSKTFFYSKFAPEAERRFSQATHLKKNYRAVALKNPFEVHRSVLIFHTEFKVKELNRR